VEAARGAVLKKKEGEEEEEESSSSAANNHHNHVPLPFPPTASPLAPLPNDLSTLYTTISNSAQEKGEEEEEGGACPSSSTAATTTTTDPFLDIPAALAGAYEEMASSSKILSNSTDTEAACGISCGEERGDDSGGNSGGNIGDDSGGDRHGSRHSSRHSSRSCCSSCSFREVATNGGAMHRLCKLAAAYAALGDVQTAAVLRLRYKSLLIGCRSGGGEFGANNKNGLGEKEQMNRCSGNEKGGDGDEESAASTPRRAKSLVLSKALQK
jgi:hypothetical protein